MDSPFTLKKCCDKYGVEVPQLARMVYDQLYLNRSGPLSQKELEWAYSAMPPTAWDRFAIIDLTEALARHTIALEADRGR